jgi:hypothetical protein
LYTKDTTSSLLLDKTASSSNDVGTGSGDPADRAELLSLKSSLRILRRNQFREIAYEKERQMRRIMDNSLNKKNNSVLLTELRKFSKDLEQLEPQILTTQMVDLTNTKTKGSIDYQWMKQCKYYETFQQQLSQFHNRLTSSVPTYNQKVSTSENKIGSISILPTSNTTTTTTTSNSTQEYQLIVNKSSLRQVFESLISY